MRLRSTVMTRIGVILGSTRPGRRGAQVAEWVMENTKNRTDAAFELIDLADYPLPHLDEPLPPSMGQYQNAHTQDWAARIAQYDGFIFVTPEYNHSTSGVLKNAIDFLYAEWNNKAMGVVSYGAAGGVRAAEHLRLIAGELQMADVRTNVALSLFTDFENFTEFTPSPHQAHVLATLFGEVIAWSQALAPLRDVDQAAAYPGAWGAWAWLQTERTDSSRSRGRSENDPADDGGPWAVRATAQLMGSSWPPGGRSSWPRRHGRATMASRRLTVVPTMTKSATL